MIRLLPAARPFQGTLRVPGDKSISHRSVMIGALAQGVTEVTGFLNGADCMSTISCFRKLGVRIEETRRRTDGAPMLKIHGKGLYGLDAPAEPLFAGNSGTTVRLMSGILAAQAFTSTLTGDESLCTRPMRRVMEPLTQMGAGFTCTAGNDCCPMQIRGARLRATDYTSPVASAQVKSAVLLASLYADGVCTVRERVLSRDHTERMLAAFGADIRIADARDLAAEAALTGAEIFAGYAVRLTPGRMLRARKIHVPADISSAAFIIGAALLTPGSDVTLTDVGVNPTRSGILQVLEKWGAQITVEHHEESDAHAEPRADIRARASSLCCPGGTLTIGGSLIPALIDELPLIAVLAAFAEGTTVIKDAAELRVKESDRIALLTENLRGMGADVEERPDGMIIRGGKPLHGTTIKTHGDHRIAMGFAVAALAAEGETIIDNDVCIAVSYPGFFKDLTALS